MNDITLSTLYCKSISEFCNSQDYFLQIVHSICAVATRENYLLFCIYLTGNGANTCMDCKSTIQYGS